MLESGFNLESEPKSAAVQHIPMGGAKTSYPLPRRGSDPPRSEVNKKEAIATFIATPILPSPEQLKFEHSTALLALITNGPV